MNTDDRELLELAAKAGGLTVLAALGPDKHCLCLMVRSKGRRQKYRWRPNLDSDDALNLACAMSADIYIHQATVVVEVGEVKITESLNGRSKPMATRRAIVRAAAEIGKRMP